MVNHKAFGNIHLGLAATAFASILGLLQVPELDTPLTITLICFSISLPFNIFCGIFSYKDENVNTPYEFDKLTVILSITTAIICFTAVSCIIFHFSHISALVFIIASFFALFLITSRFS